jgi:hypothetical protein
MIDQTSPISGKCMCGSVRYSLSTEPKFALICQCRDCQHITGTGHSALFGANRQNAELTGRLGAYEYSAESGSTMTSEFCSNCGNPIFKTSSRFPDLYFFHAATLEDPSQFKPTRAVWCASAQGWDSLNPSLKQEP